MASLTATLAEGARIVVVAPLYGVPVDWDAIEQCVRTFGAVAVEDARRDSGGASWRGGPARQPRTGERAQLRPGQGVDGGRVGRFSFVTGVHLPEGALPDTAAVGEVSVAPARSRRPDSVAPRVNGVPAASPGCTWVRRGTGSRGSPRDEPDRGCAARAHPTPGHTRGRCPALQRVMVHGSDRIASRHPVRQAAAGGTPATSGCRWLLARGIDGPPIRGLARRLGVARGTRAPWPRCRLWPATGDLGRCRGDELVAELVTLPTHSLVRETDWNRWCACSSAPLGSRAVREESLVQGGVPLHHGD